MLIHIFIREDVRGCEVCVRGDRKSALHMTQSKNKTMIEMVDIKRRAEQMPGLNEYGEKTEAWIREPCPFPSVLMLSHRPLILLLCTCMHMHYASLSFVQILSLMGGGTLPLPLVVFLLSYCFH